MRGNGPFYVSETALFEQPTSPTQWSLVDATTLAGAKRLAAKRARGVTFSARVAVRDAQGQIQTLATMHNSAAITRRRAMWRTDIH